MPSALNLGLSVEKGHRYINIKKHETSVSCSAEAQTNVMVFKSRYCHKKTLHKFNNKSAHLVFSVSKKKKPPKDKGDFHIFHIPINPWGKMYFTK